MSTAAPAPIDTPVPDPEITAWNESLASMDALSRVRWAVERFGSELVLSTSFGVQAAVMLHLVTEVVPGLPVVFVDTGYLFPETYRFADELSSRLNLNLKVYNPLITAARQEALFGKRWEAGTKEALDEYNKLNKVEPMARALRELGATAWLSGLRRSQSSSRAGRTVIERQKRTHKIYPIIEWTDRDVYQYLTKHNLPYHPLWDQGYVSVGDWHSTSKLLEGMTEEQTRFGGLKRECGLHETSKNGDWSI